MKLEDIDDSHYQTMLTLYTSDVADNFEPPESRPAGAASPIHDSIETHPRAWPSEPPEYPDMLSKGIAGSPLASSLSTSSPDTLGDAVLTGKFSLKQLSLIEHRSVAPSLLSKNSSTEESDIYMGSWDDTDVTPWPLQPIDCQSMPTEESEARKRRREESESLEVAKRAKPSSQGDEVNIHPNGSTSSAAAPVTRHRRGRQLGARKTSPRGNWHGRKAPRNATARVPSCAKENAPPIRESTPEVDAIPSLRGSRFTFSFPSSASTSTPGGDLTGGPKVAGLRLKIDAPVHDDVPGLAFPGVRKSKLLALRRLQQGTSDLRDSRPPSPSSVHEESDRKEQESDYEEDAEGIPECEYEADVDDCDGAEIGVPRRKTTAKSPRNRRKAITSKESVVKRRGRAGKKRQSNRGRASKTHQPHVIEGRRYSRHSDWKRFEVGSLHGPLWCLFCQEGVPQRSRWSRVRDSPKRHLRSSPGCPRFRQSRYYRTREAAGMSHDEIVEEAVADRVVAGAGIHCPNDKAQQAKFAATGLTHADVLRALEPRSTMYKMEDCDCCDYPHISTFHRQR
ncbi:hypothetical protein C8Q77DRAFT_1160852 [Trametes polyzona]|nr:hypothetical protein C8Q77DRAFT_1160852 [Trametes polyzona]